MSKHALPAPPPKRGKHAGYYDVALEVQHLIKELAQLLRRL